MEHYFLAYIGSIIAILDGILFIPIGLPLLFRKIKRNNFYGFRIKYTLQDDEIWFEVNEMLGRHMVYQGAVILVIGILSLFLVQGRTAQFIFLFVVLAIMATSVIYSLVKGIKLMNELALKKGLKKSL